MTPRVTFTLAILLALGASVATAPTVLAESSAKQTATEHYAKGMTAYTLGNFPEAIAEFTKAYGLKNEPIFLYNIAQAYRSDKNPDRAIFFYRRYLQADPGTKKRPVVEERIAELEQQLKAPQSPSVVPIPTAEPVTSPTAAPPAAPPPADPAPASVTEVTPTGPVEPIPSAGRGMRIAGIALGGAGVAAVATAIVFYARANSLSDRVSTSDSPSASDYQSGKTAETMQWVFYGVGAASLAAGSILYYLGWRASTDRSVSIAPVFGHGVAGLSARRAF